MKYVLTSNKGFSLVEITVVIAILAILAGSVFFVIKPFELIKEARYTKTKAELTEIAKAVTLYEAQTGDLPPDVSRNTMPAGLGEYMNTNGVWPKGPFPGSVYDYDNNIGATCIDGSADDSVIINLRQVSGYNPNGSNVWSIYYVIRGNGTAHCTNSSEQPYGECINCTGE